MTDRPFDKLRADGELERKIKVGIARSVELGEGDAAISVAVKASKTILPQGTPFDRLRAGSLVSLRPHHRVNLKAGGKNGSCKSVMLSVRMPLSHLKEPLFPLTLIYTV